jgi:threonine dehydratase
LPGTERHPAVEDIRSAAERLKGIAVRTPLLESEKLNSRLGARVLLKCEMFQPVGAFKIRGAWNLISRLTERERANGVVAFSSGNHAQAVAWAARRFDIPSTIVMPSDAPSIKIENTRALGADVVLYDRNAEDRENITRQIVDRTGAVIVPPYDHPEIIAGQGTVGLEICEQCDEYGTSPDLVVVPCSGGGLVAGCSISLKDRFPDVDVYAAEPEMFDDTARSLAAGKRLRNPPGSASICDALLVPTPGELTFEINRKNLSGAVAVTDQDIRKAVWAAFMDARLVVEPGGAAGLAAALAGHLDIEDRTVCIVLSGGNIDAALLADILRNPEIFL